MSIEDAKRTPEVTVPRSPARPGRREKRKQGAVQSIPVRSGARPAPAEQVDPARGFLEPELAEPDPGANESVER
jgi:hypothetical protein